MSTVGPSESYRGIELALQGENKDWSVSRLSQKQYHGKGAVHRIIDHSANQDMLTFFYRPTNLNKESWRLYFPIEVAALTAQTIYTAKNAVSDFKEGCNKLIPREEVGLPSLKLNQVCQEAGMGCWISRRWRWSLLEKLIRVVYG